MVEWVKIKEEHEKPRILYVLVNEVRADCRELQIMLNAKGAEI